MEEHRLRPLRPERDENRDLLLETSAVQSKRCEDKIDELSLGTPLNMVLYHGGHRDHRCSNSKDDCKDNLNHLPCVLITAALGGRVMSIEQLSRKEEVGWRSPFDEFVLKEGC